LSGPWLDIGQTTCSKTQSFRETQLLKKGGAPLSDAHGAHFLIRYESLPFINMQCNSLPFLLICPIVFHDGATGT
jgi:hypothetical protein